MFIDGKDVVENAAAEQAARDDGAKHSCGSCCGDPVLAQPACFVAANWGGGWISKPVVRILQNTGASLVALTSANISAQAAAMSGSTNPYGACPYEILLGSVDVCLGDFWETEERRNLVAFTTPLDVNSMKLITTAVESSDFGPNRLFDIFLPFTATVWGTMMGMFCFTAVLMWIVSVEENEDFSFAETFPQPRGLVKGFWVAMMGYLAGNQFATDKWSARLIVLGFSFFLAISIASYTANLASFMVLKPRAAGAVESLNDIVKRTKKVCTIDSISDMLTVPGIRERVVEAPNGFMGSLFEQLHMGHCDAAIVGKMEYRLYVQAESMQYDICTTESDPNYAGGWFCFEEESTLTRFDLTKCQCGTEPAMQELPSTGCPSHCIAPTSKFCNVIELFDPALDVAFNYALPVSDWVEPYISAGILAAKMSGQFQNDVNSELLDANPPSCPEGTPQYSSNNPGSGDDAMALGLDSMAGTFVFSAALMLLGLLLHIVQALVLPRTIQPEEEPGHDAPLDTHPTGSEGQEGPAETRVASESEPEGSIKAQSEEPSSQPLEARMGTLEARLGGIEQNLARLVAALGEGRGGSFTDKRGSFARRHGESRGSFRKGQGQGSGSQRQGEWMGGFLSFQPWR